MAVLVTGGAGYIGSHIVHALLDQNHRVVVLDDLSTGLRSQVPGKAAFIQGDIGNTVLVTDLIGEFDIAAVMHFAGSIVVPDSVREPLSYYDNNVVKSRALLQSLVRAKVRHFIFSSTAAVYSEDAPQPLKENAPKAPISPYARSKLMMEWMLEDVARAHDLKFTILRYFNVAGADPKGRTGQSTPNATHLIKRAAKVALGREPYLNIFGTDYRTPDGTGVRDYIHVSDLAAAHVLALEALYQGAQPAVYNCGYGKGFSVREVVAAMERVIQRELPIREVARRPGDPARLVSDPTKIKKTLGWTPVHGDLDGILRSALEWERRFNDWQPVRELAAHG